MTSREPVDFVVGAAPDDDADEELVERPRWSPRMLWAVGVAALGVAAVVAIANRHDDPAPRAAASPTRPQVSSSTDVVALDQPIRVPEGNRSPRPLPVCPANASCYSDTGVPGSTLSALRRYFPSAQVTSAAEVLVNRTGRFGPDLLSREVHARAGSVDITLVVGKPRRGDRDAFTFDRTGQLLHSLDTHAGSAFTVSVEVVQLGPKHRPSRTVLDRIARDPRLVVPQ